jgi:hypothetical protein
MPAGSADLASASASESGAAKLHIRSIAENADFRQAYAFGREFMIWQARPNISGVQSKKACDKDDDYDDADDVENVHGVLRVRHARFQYESTTLQQETCPSTTKFRTPRPELRSLAPLFFARAAIALSIIRASQSAQNVRPPWLCHGERSD